MMEDIAAKFCVTAIVVISFSFFILKKLYK